MFKYIKSLSTCRKISEIIALPKPFYIYPSFDFSKKFYEKRAKIKNYLSKEKEQYRNNLMSKRRIEIEEDYDPLKFESSRIIEVMIDNQKIKVQEDPTPYEQQILKSEILVNSQKSSLKKKERMNKIVKNTINHEKNHSYLFYNSKIQKLLIENYSIIPTLFSTTIVNKFISELKTNLSYSDYLKDWYKKSEEEKNILVKEERIKLYDLDIYEYKYFKPILDLFIYYIHSNYISEIESLKFLSTLSDMTMPHNWYPQARKHKRTIYYHMGPTNSGKTFEALQKLKNAKTGIYCAPLRLLAWEIYDKLTKSEIKCILKTGQEIIEADNATHFACTVEICPLTVHYDCAVIDEIQLIADESRGAAWTNAFLGLKADEIHLCGDERALHLIYQLCLLTGDKLIKKSYTRLSDLVVEEENVHSVSQLKKGDCIIAFSKREIFKLKNLINESNFKPGDISSSNSSDSSEYKSGIKNRCAIIYGSLPPETKKIQASKFNNGEDGIKYLVATDAIGLGLNLKIRRIIFSQITKRDHQGVRFLTEFEVKQIAGRAGRSENQGHVSAFKSRDLDFIRTCCSRTRHHREKRKVAQVVVYDGQDDDEISKEPSKQENDYDFKKDETLIKKACLFPPLQIIEEFSDSFLKFKNTSNSEKYKRMHPSLSETLQQFENIGKLSDLYFMKNLSELLKIHKIIEDVHEADIKTQYFFTICPIRVTPNTSKYLHFFLVQFVKYSMVKLPQDFHLQNKNFTKAIYKMHELPTFEEVYNVLEVYIWLSYKFEKEFIERELARVMKDRVSKIIDSILHSMKFDIYSDLRKEKIEVTSDEEEHDDKKQIKFIEASNSTNETNENNNESNERIVNE